MFNININLEKQIKTHYIIHKFSTKASAGVAEKVWKKKLVLTKPWIVLENINNIKPLLIDMLMELGALYEVKISENDAKFKVNLFLVKQAPKFVVGGLVTIKGVSELTNATIAGLLTEKLGWGFVGTLTKEAPDSDSVGIASDNGKEKMIMNSFGIDIPYEKRIKCHLVIHSAATAIMGTSFVPVVGIYTINAIQAGMIVSLAKIFNVPMSLEMATKYLATLVTNKSWEGTKAIVANTLLIRKIGNATVAAILTERLGWQVAQEFYNKTKNK